MTHAAENHCHNLGELNPRPHARQNGARGQKTKTTETGAKWHGGRLWHINTTKYGGINAKKTTPTTAQPQNITKNPPQIQAGETQAGKRGTAATAK
ncbi:MAG: hypothetical protein OXU71_00785 [Gammaproteobacteria bacterium]|nr:hypothetical protein [Gammaproteobacteria bacterium]